MTHAAPESAPVSGGHLPPVATGDPLQPARPPAGPPAVEVAAGPSITEYLTDGSTAAMCDALARLTGVRVELQDPDGRIVRQVERPDGSFTWELAEPAPGVGAAGGGETRFPLRVAGARIADVVVGPGAPRLSGEARQSLEAAASIFASTAAELCQNEHDLRDRLREIASLARMSSLLVRAASPERALDVALDAALEALSLDAGNILLLQEDADGATSDGEADLVLKASRNLSEDWLRSPLPLSRERLFDRLALAGQVVVSEDLSRDDRVAIKDRAAAEGLRAAIHAGLVFKSRPFGVLRLYSRAPRRFREPERRLVAALAQQAAAALEQARLLRFEREEQRVQRQLQLAADVQRRMMPRGVPSVPSVDVAARYSPSFELGGDFYDLIDLNGHVGIAVGDVAGKGVAAALLMSAVRSSLRAHVEKTYDLDEVVSRVNVAMCRDTRDNEFASLWYGVIDPRTNRLTYCSAGHEPPLVFRVPAHRPPNSTDVDELIVGGMVVGIDPSQRYQRALYELHPGDVLVAYTDGVTDALNFSGERFKRKRLRDGVLRFLASNPRATAAAVLEHIFWELRQFCGLAPSADDRTVLVVRVASAGHAAPGGSVGPPSTPPPTPNAAPPAGPAFPPPSYAR